jgi:hypothetical protein
MTAAELKLKSPFIPLFQRGNFLSRAYNPSLEKEGPGEISAENVEAIIQRISDTPR